MGTTDDIVTLARRQAEESVDARERAWIIALAHMAEMPAERVFTVEEARDVIDVCDATAVFPSGPVGLTAGGFDIEENPDFQLINLSVASAPHLRYQIGFGNAGFVALGLTRSGVIDEGITRAGAVLLSDYESVLGDVVTVGIAAALQLGYTGRIDFHVWIAYAAPGATCTYYALDAENAQLYVTGESSPDESPVVHGGMVLEESTTPRQIHTELYALGCGLAASFGVPEPQLIHPPSRETTSTTVRRCCSPNGRPPAPELRLCRR